MYIFAVKLKVRSDPIRCGREEEKSMEQGDIQELTEEGKRLDARIKKSGEERTRQGKRKRAGEEGGEQSRGR